MEAADAVTRAAPQDEQLRRYLEELDALRLDARALAQDLTHEQFNWRPEPRRWSIGQCLEHLTLSVRLYPEKIEAMFREAEERRTQGRRPYREGWFTNWIIRSLEPPSKLKGRTIEKASPPPELDRDTTLRDFDESHAQLGELIRRADGLPLTQGRTASPFVPLIRFTLNQVFAINLAHGRRHLWQARQVRNEPGFPAS